MMNGDSTQFYRPVVECFFMAVKSISLTGQKLDLAQLNSVAREGFRVALASSARTRVKKSRAFLDKEIAKGQALYGITTGFGPFASVRISDDNLRHLQENLIRSHSAGVGPCYCPAETRAIMLARANVLAKGYSAVTPKVLDTLIAALNKDILPLIPEQGSVGASGDLAPLAHLALALIGEGKVRYKGKVMTAKAAFKQARLKPVTLAPKDGLALINGTQVLTAVGGLALHRAWETSRLCDIACAMTLTSLKGSKGPFDARLHKLRPHQGQKEAAANLRKILSGHDRLMASHKDCGKVQDNYALRCSPQVHGSTRDALRTATETVEIELNSATDNPVVLSGDRIIIPGGNFHGQPVSQVLDYAAIGMTTLANISERRVERLVNAAYSGLPAFLIKDGGLNSGFMMAQVTAAALASENKILAHPASVDSIPTSANQEDHVSMGVTAARKFREIEKNTRTVVAIEMLAAAQALDFLKPLTPSKALTAVHRRIRKSITHLKKDRVLSIDINKMLEMFESGELLSAAEKNCGKLL